MTRLKQAELDMLISSGKVKIPESKHRNVSGSKNGTAKHPRLNKKTRSPLELRFLRDLRALNLPGPISEFKFHDTRKWRLDFYWPDYRLALEVDGGTRNHGQKRKDGSTAISGHLTPDGYQRDCEKGNHAVMAGIALMRADSDMVTKGLIYPQLEAALIARGWIRI